MEYRPQRGIEVAKMLKNYKGYSLVTTARFELVPYQTTA